MIRLTVPNLNFNDVRQNLDKVITSGWLTRGAMTEQFENSVSQYVNTRYAIAVNSGTSALHLALLSVGVGSNDEVLVPAYTFPATANVVENCGAHTVLVDIDLDSFNISVQDLKRKITSRTKAIIVVHQFGTPANMSSIIKIARARKIKIIEDAACAIGAEYNNKMCGSMSDVACFSFHPRKIITTGEGGMITTNNLKIARFCQQMRNHGSKLKGSLPSFERAGFNFIISEVAAAIGISQMKRIMFFIKERRRIARQLNRLLGKNDLFSRPYFFEDRKQVFQSYVILLNKKINRELFIGGLKKFDIESTIGNYAIHIQPYFRRKYDYKVSDLPSAYEAYKRSVSLPFYTGLTSLQIQKLVKSVLSVGDKLYEL